MSMTLTIIVLVIAVIGLVIIDIKTPDEEKLKFYLTVILAGAMSIAVTTISEHIAIKAIESHMETHDHYDSPNSTYKVE